MGRLRSWLMQKRLRRELDQELQHHRDTLTEQFLAQGLPATEARRHAELEMGNATRIREEFGDLLEIPILSNLWRDIRFSLRSLARNPGLTAMVLLTFAFSLGINTAMFTVIQSVLLSPLPYPDADRLVWITTPTSLTPDGALGIYRQVWQDESKSLAKLTSVLGTDTDYETSDGGLVRLRTTTIRSGVEELLGVRPAIGRDFIPDDAGSGNVIISHPLFKRLFGGDIRNLNSTLSGKTVVGVLPRGFRLPLPSNEYGKQQDVELLFPIARRSPYVSVEASPVIGRLADGVSIETAEAELNTLSANVPESQRYGPIEGVRIVPLQERMVGDVRPALLLLWIAAGFLLLVACANITNLLLARSAARSGEVALRFALGATRAGVLRALLTETMVLAVIGGGIGVLLAIWMTPIVIQWIPFEVPLFDGTPNRTVLGVGFLTCLAAGLLSGLVPARIGSRRGVAGPLKAQAGASRPRGNVRLQSVLVAAELALTLVLLTGAGVALRTIWNLRNDTREFQPDHVLVAEGQIRNGSAAQSGRMDFYKEFTSRLEALPSVEAASVWHYRHYGGYPTLNGRTEAERSATNRAGIGRVTEGFRKASGIRLLAGRWLAERDGRLEHPPAVVNQAAFEIIARQANGELTKPADLVGHQINAQGPMDPFTIVGVVSGFHPDPSEPPEAQIYFPMGDGVYPMTGDFFQVLLRSAGPVDATNVAGDLRRVAEEWTGAIVIEPQTLTESVNASIAPQRVQGDLLTTLAVSGLFLAIFGVYGVLHYTVGQRAQEIGVRMALGAEPRAVLAMVMKRSFYMALAGIGIGCVAALGLARFLESWLVGVEPNDPATYIAVAALLVFTALAGAFLPARKAASIHPSEVLRHE